MEKYTCGSFGIRFEGIGGSWRVIEKHEKGFLLWESETYGSRAKKILTDPAEIQQLTKTKLYRPKGCQNCRNTGYLGRLAVLEILVINNEIRKLIAQRAHDVEIEDYAVKQGMKTLKMSCLRHILEGETSIDEQVRILGLASEES